MQNSSIPNSSNPACYISQWLMGDMIHMHTRYFLVAMQLHVFGNPNPMEENSAESTILFYLHHENVVNNLFIDIIY